MQRIAVVLPFRNASHWLPESIASLRRQQGVELELIAVDDGSHDNSAMVLEQLWQGSPWPLRLLRLPGLGVSAARNRGWRSTTAPLVAFLDADDLCLPGRLAGQAAMLKANPELAHCLCGWRRLRADGRILQDVRPWREGAAFDFESVLRHKAVLPSAWMLRRQALEAMQGFAEGLRHAEDVDLLLRLALANQRGRWLEQLGCGYRVHEGGASRQVAEQTRSLLWVMEQQLQHLPAKAGHLALRRELRYATRAWTGWKAWSEGQNALALELWRTALGQSPMPPVRSWLHLAEQARRSCLRDGLPWQPEALLASATWQTLGRELVERWPWWGERELEALRRDLIASLGPNPAASPWWPGQLQRQLSPDDPLQPLRASLLDCSQRLLTAAEPNRPLPPAVAVEVRQALAAIALQWAVLCWSEDRRPTARQLELSLMLNPDPHTLKAYGTLQRQEHPAGAAAVNQLADLFTGSGTCTPLAWAETTNPPDHERCQGPACRRCGDQLLASWCRQPLAGGGVLWQVPANGSPSNTAPWRVHQLAEGRCWVRTPGNVWGMTHGLGVAKAEGTPLPGLCRRYPQPWPGCPHPPMAVEQPPTTEPERIEGVVLAVADLSAEIYYHWLVEQLPRLGLALEQLPGDINRQQLRVWHNGGRSSYVAEGLRQTLGLKPEQLLAADAHPHISATLLLVPDFSGSFGVPAPQAVRWLRQHFLAQAPEPSPQQGRRVWLGRGQGWRRPVIGEAATLEQLRSFGVEPVDPGQLSLMQQAALLASAELVVLPHGGAMANLVFARPGTRVLELHGPRYRPPYAQGLAQALQLRLASCEQPQKPPRLYREWLYEAPIMEPIVLEPERIATCLAALLANTSNT